MSYFKTMVSILIPVYNAAKCLPKCLESIFSQDYSSIEVIAVNDGSTDNSLDILKQYALKYPSLKIYSQSNQGHQSARQLAIEQSRGDYICFVDSDDSLPDSNVISKMVAVADVGVQIVVGYINIDNGITKKVFPVSMFDTISASEYLKQYLMCGKCGWNLCGKLFKSELVKSVNGSPIRVSAGEDALYTILMTSNTCGNVTMVHMPVYNYYMNQSSITHQYSAKLVYDNYKVATYLDTYLRDKVEVKYRVALRLLCYANSFRYGYLGSKHYTNSGTISDYKKTTGVMSLFPYKKRIIIWILIWFGDFISKYIFKNRIYETES